MYQLLSVKSWVFVIWLVLISVALYVRPLFPIDETRYAAVAWEMWLRGDFLVPHLNGDIYSHKPPLLFWLMQLTWLLFGVNDWSLRLISPLFALGSVYLSAALARMLWPERKAIADRVPIMLLGSGFWAVFSTLTMFDMMLAFFVSLGIYSVLKLAQAGLTLPRWLLLGVAIGGGVMSKGPVILLHVLPVAVLAPWWNRAGRSRLNWLQWYGGLVFSILLGAVLALCWAIPAGFAGGEAYRNAIFWGQTQGRLVESFAHQLPWWWYAQYMPVLLLPWLLIKPLWLGLKTLTLQDAGLRFCVAWGVPLFIAFSLISGKRLHYLLPMFPLFILVLARAADQVSARHCAWRCAKQGCLAFIGMLGIVMALAPWVNELTYGSHELAMLSPLWGVFLLIAVSGLWREKTQNSQEAVFIVSIATVIALLVISSAFFSVRSDRFDTREIGKKIAEIFAQNREVAYLVNAYHGEYQFTGRLRKPIKVFSNIRNLAKWGVEHPDAYVLIRVKQTSDLPVPSPYYQHRYKSLSVALLPIDVLLSAPGLIKTLVY